MTQQHQHQQQRLQQQQLTDQESSDESQNPSSDHSNSSKTTNSSTPENENSHDESQDCFQQEDGNESSNESPPPQQKQHNSQDALFISKQQVLQNYAKYGEIVQSPDPNFIHIRLYRLPTMLTTTEYEHASKHMIYHKMGQKPCLNYHVVDVTKKTMFRCPFPSCEHTPLNNLMIHQALKRHCQIYHNDGNNYIFEIIINSKKNHQLSKTTNSSTPENENSHDKSQDCFQQEDGNESSNESPPPQQKQHNSQDALFISKQQVLQNYAKYGEIVQSPDPNFIHIRLYRLPTMLTTTEYEHASKHMIYHKMGQKPCLNYHVVDVTKKTMFRCPFPSCEHTPLNNLMIHQALKRHCQIYHNDGNNYIFEIIINSKKNHQLTQSIFLTQ